MGERVLVTGATGFIGSHAAESLCARGYEVHALSSQPEMPAAHANGIQWHQCDLMDKERTKKIVKEISAQSLLHLAWYVRPGKLISSSVNFDWVDCSMSLVRSFHEAGGKRIACSGSCYEYDWRYGYCSEQLTPTTPDTIYGACKNAFREMLEAYCRHHEIGFGWGRIFFLYGPRENPNRLVSSVILSLLGGQDAKSSHGRQVRDYGHVADMAEGMVALLESEYSGCLNIATGRITEIREIVTSIGEITGAGDRVRIGALPARPNDLPLVVADVSLANEVLSWRPRFALHDGLVDTVEWWKQNLDKHGERE